MITLSIHIYIYSYIIVSKTTKLNTQHICNKGRSEPKRQQTITHLYDDITHNTLSLYIHIYIYIHICNTIYIYIHIHTYLCISKLNMVSIIKLMIMILIPIVIMIRLMIMMILSIMLMLIIILILLILLLTVLIIHYYIWTNCYMYNTSVSRITYKYNIKQHNNHTSNNQAKPQQ